MQIQRKDNLYSKKRIEIIFIVFICVISGLFQSIYLTSINTDTDIFWHYKLGEEIIKTHIISLENTMTFLQNTEWIPQEWLYEIILYSIIYFFGYYGTIVLYIVNILIILLITSFNNKSKSRIIYTIVASIIFTITPINRGNRPSEFSIYFILLLVYLYSKNESNIKKLQCAILGVTIANFHGGTILIMIALWIIMLSSDIIIDLYKKEKLDFKIYLNKFLDLVIFILCTFINPSGPKLLYTIFKISSLDTTSKIMEWMPTECTYLIGIFISLVLISFGYTIYRTNFNKYDIRMIAINVALLILSLKSQKAFIVFDVVWFMYGYKYLENFIIDTFKNKIKPVKKSKIICYIINTTTPAIIVFVTLSLILCLDTALKEGNNDYISRVNERVSKNIIDTLKYNYKDNTKILTSYNYGNYIILNDMKCFVDSRQWPYAKELGTCDAVDELFYIQYDGNNDFEAIEKFLDKYKFDYIWTCKELNIDEYLSKCDNYRLVISEEVDSKNIKETGNKPDKIYYRDLSNKESLWVRTN